jgi:hypothetical protein
LPWRVEEVVVKHISHLDELAGQFDQLFLNEVECIKGFDPNDLFIAHISRVGYSSYFTKIKQYKGGGDNLNLPETSFNEAMNDMEELASTNEFYQQQGRYVTNKTPNSPIVSQKGTPTKTKPRSNGLEMRKTPAKK